MRAVIYARYSTDMQREASIEDQIRVCTALAERLGVAVEHVYADYAISGTKADRPQFLALHAEIARGGVDVVLAESLDRLSRDQEHIAGLFKQTSFRGVKLITVAEGEVSEIHIGLKGTMNALFLKDLGLKTHRGLEGRVAAGRSAGGLSFGYRVPKRFGADGAPVTGEMEIEQSEAALVRRVFAAYIGGQSPRSIAKTLNAAGVPGPRGGKWTASLLLGNAIRETGILRNSLYVGERVWKRPLRRVNNGTPRPITVHRDFLTTHRDLVVRYLAVLFRSAAWAEAHPQDAIRLIAKEDGRVGEAITAAAYPLLATSLTPSLSEAYIAGLDAQKNFLRDWGFLGGDFETRDWIIEGPLEEARALVAGETRSAA